MKVETSKAKRICFVTNCHKRGVFMASSGEFITQGEFPLSEKVKWVYVEVMDEAGKKAYSRAFFKDELENV